jgi:NAD(P)-dependent dehydrogenase (short-subunit alcohol dehydrogenase family)
MSKIALITGATGNLGKAVTQKMLSSGFTVIGTMEPGKDESSIDEQVTYKTVDLTDPEAADSLILEIVSHYGKIDAVVCLVGGFDMATIPESSYEALQKMITLNFFTAFNVVKPVLRSLPDNKERKHIILVGAKPVFEPQVAKMVFPYAISKSMVVKMAEVINADSEQSNISATVIIPSIIDTPPNRAAMPDANFSDWVTPESIADKIAFISGAGGKDLRETILKIYGNS